MQDAAGNGITLSTLGILAFGEFFNIFSGIELSWGSDDFGVMFIAQLPRGAIITGSYLA